MQKWGLLSGIAIAIVILLASLLSGNWMITLNAGGVVGLAAWIISGILTGSMNSGDRIRANLATESRRDRQQRMRWATVFFLLGLPNLICVVVVFVLDHYAVIHM